jgi:hypothetical protein
MRRIAIVPDVFRKRLVLQVFRWLHGVGHCLHTISLYPSALNSNRQLFPQLTQAAHLRRGRVLARNRR